MNLSLRNKTAPFAVITLLWTSVMIERAHTDVIVGSGTGTLVLVQHSCGSTERHLSPERLHQCIVCAQGGQRVSTLPAEYHPPAVSPVIPAAFILSQSQPLIIDYLYSGKRGPPAGMC